MHRLGQGGEDGEAEVAELGVAPGVALRGRCAGCCSRRSATATAIATATATAAASRTRRTSTLGAVGAVDASTAHAARGGVRGREERVGVTGLRNRRRSFSA